MQCVHIIKCAKVRALFAENKVRFARAEQMSEMENLEKSYIRMYRDQELADPAA